MPRLTIRYIDDLKLTPARIDRTHWDENLKGFGLRVRASGAMSWIIMYRNRDNRLRKYTIGQVGALTPDEARNEARQKLADVHRGIDPSADKSAQRNAMTIAILCDRYQEYSKARVKASTWKMDQSRIDCHIKPLLGTRKIESLKLADIENLQRDVATGKSAKAIKRQGRGGTTRGGRGVAARTVSMMGTVLEYARRQGLVTSNVARGVQKYAIGKRTRFLSYEEIAELGKAMGVAAERGENKTALAAITALALTGCRRQEILDLPWDWIDGQRKCIRFADTKTGAQLRPIGESAVAHLLAQPKLETCGWVFPASNGEGSFVGAPRIFLRICTAAKIEGVSLHTLRHTFASVAADLGYSELTIAGLLGHRGSSVTARYAHVPDRALVSAADQVADVIARALKGETTVISMKATA
jgi:integrase